VLSPADICLGTNPSQAPIAATIALGIIGPMPGTVISPVHAACCPVNAVISAG